MKCPVIFFPTRVYWVDDDSLFLSVVKERFEHDLDIISSLSAKDTLKFFSSYQSKIDSRMFLTGCPQYDEYDLVKHLPVDIDFSKIKMLFENLSRNNEISVIIVDYQMSEMTGIALCEKLSSSSAKKILLTGHADINEAINALNKGVIDYFLCKDEPEIDKKLLEIITRLKEEYFYDQTKAVVSHIESDILIPHTDIIFSSFFQTLRSKNCINEYYLADKFGGMILKDKFGATYYLALYTDRSLNNFCDLHSEDESACEYIELIKTRKKIPFFGDGEEMWGKEVKEWSKYFYDVEVLKGRENYYFSLVSLTR